MYCRKCGAQIGEGAQFCRKCGVKVVYVDSRPQKPVTPQTESNIKDNVGFKASLDDHVRKTTEFQSEDESSQKEQVPDEKETSELKEWWDECSTAKKVVVMLGGLVAGGFVLYALIAFLREFGTLLFGVLVVGAFILAMFTGSKEEKMEARKAIVKVVAGAAIIAAIAFVIVHKPDFVFDIIQPGAYVRNAYLTQYSESITVEDAFNRFFDNGKWDTYKEGGYSYVVFTGTGEYAGDEADMRITFKITGEYFLVDRLDINGVKQNDLILALLLETVYEDD